LKSDLKRRITK